MADHFTQWFGVGCLSLITLLTILINCAMIGMMTCTRTLREDSKNHVILSLSFADCLIGLVLMPVGIVAYVNDHILVDDGDVLGAEVFHNNHFQQVWSVLLVLFDDVSLLHLVFINIIKYKSVKTPLQFLVWMTTTKARVISAAIWSGVTVATMLLYGIYLQDLGSLMISQVGFVIMELPFFAVIATNVMCFNVVRKLAYHHVLSSLQTSTRHSYLFDARNVAQSKTSVLARISWRMNQTRATVVETFRQRDVPVVKAGVNLCVQTAIFFICWFPQAVVYPFFLFGAFEGDASKTEQIYNQKSHFFVVSWFAWTNALMNPLIHVAFDKTIKEVISKKIRRLRLNRSLQLDQAGYRKATCIPAAMVVEIASLIEHLSNCGYLDDDEGDNEEPEYRDDFDDDYDDDDDCSVDPLPSLHTQRSETNTYLLYTNHSRTHC